MSSPGVPETSVLAIASHVAYGYVGNTMATFVMQSLGCEVTAINTVHYSNHTGYKQFKGRKATADEILDLYAGLAQSGLNDAFDVLLSGYIPSADAVAAVGKIARDLRLLGARRPGGFFWVLDPVMGDQGRLYVPKACVPAYKALLPSADLILPNQFEAELLSDTKITDLSSLARAVHVLHRVHGVPHVVITSLRLDHTSTYKTTDAEPGEEKKEEEEEEAQQQTLTIIGSTSTTSHKPRLFRIDVPAYPIFFSGTGDMFAALAVARLREAVAEAGLLRVRSWKSGDEVRSGEGLPLARACERVCASMGAVLGKTAVGVRGWEGREGERGGGGGGKGDGDNGEGEGVERARHLARTRAAEVKVVRNVEDLRVPPGVERFRARAVDVDVDFDADVGVGGGQG
ncbi:Ribokinase-like protein [Pseudovirgaria hyperparasitica]|uniref:pyridoxal kinase n=1 Tax=Pseudovirgaria hyperparasitica TaxID=470096 RepID=A0A6A6W6B4_9PEZI|nr:Ribokinase-like protein [Pseudovirgaria hyperparasitica]KAF2756611.1 Ribokinase-like protein [Pseudovirgaria hyperparasitica]